MSLFPHRRHCSNTDALSRRAVRTHCAACGRRAAACALQQPVQQPFDRRLSLLPRPWPWLPLAFAFALPGGAIDNCHNFEGLFKAKGGGPLIYISKGFHNMLPGAQYTLTSFFRFFFCSGHASTPLRADLGHHRRRFWILNCGIA